MCPLGPQGLPRWSEINLLHKRSNQGWKEAMGEKKDRETPNYSILFRQLEKTNTGTCFFQRTSCPFSGCDVFGNVPERCDTVFGAKEG